MRKITQFIMVLTITFSLVFSSVIPVSAEESSLDYDQDIAIIKERLIDYFLTQDSIDDGAKVETILVSEAKQHLDSINSDGSWSDVDYEARDNAANGRPWSPYLALDRMQALAIAYHHPDNELYQDPAVIDALNNAFIHWEGIKPSSTNWWENDIGVNLRFSRIGLFLEKDLSPESLDVIVNNLNKEGKYHGTGQNNLWYDQNAIYRALITNDAEQLKKVIEECLEYVLILQKDNVTQEALQVDNSLYFHGVQFYSNGYGLSMFRDVSFWLYMLRDTHFALSDEVKNRMSDYMLDGTRWTIRGDIAELYLGYRPYKVDVNLNNYAEEYIAPLERMMVVDVARSQEYRVLLDNITGLRSDNGASGNNYMWRVGYGSHMRDTYGVNIKMDSKRIIGGEWRGSWPKNQDSGNLVYWTASGSSTIMVDGDEYYTVYPTYDWAHAPGVTSPNYVPKDYSNYGRVSNGSDHTMGVSDGEVGSNAYIMNKANTLAKKSYFFFDDVFVAVGSDIQSKNDAPIHTTLNQTKADDVRVDGNVIASGTQNQSMDASWIYNNKVGYIFPEETTVTLNNSQQDHMPSLWNDELKENMPDTFSAWIDHGSKPENAGYTYIVLPNASVKEVETYASDNPLTIVSNSGIAHAVRHNALKMTQVNFFEAGSVEYAPGKVVAVDQASSLIIDESSGETVISLAVTDTDYNVVVNVELTDLNGTSETEFIVFEAPYTGSTMTQTSGSTNAYSASSFVEGHEVSKAFDQNLDTYWKSDSGENQWVRRSLNGSKLVSSVSIDWNDTNYAKQFKIQGSVDGHNYFDLTPVLTSEGTQTHLALNEKVSYISVELLESSHQEGYEIAEITIEAAKNIALNQTVSASSTSSNDPKNVANHAVDGDKDSRWSSSRNSDNEWLMVDFAGKATINAVEVSWEAARSEKYDIEVSDDKLNWTSVKTVTENNTLLDTHLFGEPIEGRYLRIKSSKSAQSKYGISIYELEVYGTVDTSEVEERPNLSLNKPSEASSEYVNPRTGFVYESKLAFDNSTANNGDTYQSRWVSKRESNDEWITIDLEHIYYVDTVTLNWEGAHAKAFKILTSLDNENWTESYYEQSGKAGITEHILDKPVNARYVKVQGIEPATKYGYSLWEFEVYGNEALKENVALFKETRSSSNYTNPKSGFELESKYAVDGSVVNNGDAYQSRWVSKRESNDEWIDVNLGGLYLLDSVVLNWEGAYGKAYKIQVSNDGYHWEDVAHITEGKSGIVDHAMPKDTLVQYVRMQGIEPATKYGYSLWEFEVFGYKLGDGFVDTSHLERLISEMNELSNDDYTHDTYKEFQETLNEALILLEGTPSQDTINTMFEALHTRFEALEARDDSALMTLVESADLLKPEDYTVESFSFMTDILQEAREILVQGANNNLEYYAMYTRLDEAVNALEAAPVEPQQSAQKVADTIRALTIKDNIVTLPKIEGYTLSITKSTNIDVISLDGIISPQAEDQEVFLTVTVVNNENPSDVGTTQAIRIFVEGNTVKLDYSTLEITLRLANAKQEKNYTSRSFVAMYEVRNRAQALIDEGAVDQDSIDLMNQELNDSLSALVDHRALKDTLTAMYSIDRSLYTSESLISLDKVIATAQVVFDLGNASQEEIAQAVSNLNIGYQSLERRAYDLNAIRALIEETNTLDKSFYTQDSFKTLMDYVLFVEGILGSPDLTQHEVNKMYTELVSLYKQLEKVASQPKPDIEAPLYPETNEERDTDFEGTYVDADEFAKTVDKIEESKTKPKEKANENTKENPVEKTPGKITEIEEVQSHTPVVLYVLVGFLIMAGIGTVVYFKKKEIE